MTFDIVNGLMYHNAANPCLERPFALVAEAIQRGEYLDERILHDVANVLIVSNIALDDGHSEPFIAFVEATLCLPFSASYRVQQFLLRFQGLSLSSVVSY